MIRFRCLVVLWAAMLLPMTPAWAQTDEWPSSFNVLIAQWTRILDTAESYLQSTDYSFQRSMDYRQRMQQVAKEAVSAKAETEKQIASIQLLLDALGPPAAEGDPPESESIAGERYRYRQIIQDYRARLALAELTHARAQALEEALIAARRQEALETLLQRMPLPLAPATLSKAAPEIARLLLDLARSPAVWFKSVPPQQHPAALIASFILLVGISASLGWLARRLLLSRFGRDPTLADPTYTRRFVATIAEGMARGIVPAFILSLLIYMALQPGAIVSGLFAQVFIGLLVALIFVILATALTRAVLAPELPAWRLTALALENSRRLSHRIVLIAAIFAVQLFFSIAMHGMTPSEEMRSLFAFIMASSQALCLLTLTLESLWRTVTPATLEGGAEDEDGEKGVDGTADEDASSDRRPWPWIRKIVAAMAIAGIVAILIGYVNAGIYLIFAPLLTGLIASVLFLLRGLLVEGLEALLASTSVQRRIGLDRSARVSANFWFRSILNILLGGLGIILIVPIWAWLVMPLEDIQRWLTGLLSGFTIGSATLSPLDIALAIIAFLVAMIVTRMLQRALLERILPQTNLTPGAQHSISAVTGYLGVILAITLGIAVLGVDLSNIALVAGALSVGIGFGLQNIVNNFVSGLILLVERPVKVGDWVVMGPNEGYVKNINVRSTELETFERASVIIPNADILSTAVINLTHKDLYGRIDIRVGVAFDTDPDRVRDILLNCAHRHPKVLLGPDPFHAFVLFQDFGQSRLEFELRCYTGDVNQRLTIASDLRYAIESRFGEEGIVIPLPQQVMYFAANEVSGPDHSALHFTDQANL